MSRVWGADEVRSTAGLLRSNDAGTAKSRFTCVTATPEGSLVGAVGDEALDVTNAVRYLKTSGAGNTGWAAYSAAGGVAAHAASHASGGSDPVTLAESQVTNLTSDLAAKAPLASPALTGNPTVPTAATGDSDTTAASTAFVQQEIQVAVVAGAGSPEGAVTATAGVLYRDTTNGRIYEKVGTGNTGWTLLLPLEEARSWGSRRAATTYDEYPVDRVFWNANNTMVAGTVYYIYFTCRKRRTITKLGLFVQTAPTAASTTLARCELYTAAANGDLTPVAHTANDPTRFETTGRRTTALTSLNKDGTAGAWPTTYTLLPGVDYCMGVVSVGHAGTLAVRGLNTLAALNSEGNPMYGGKSGQTDTGGGTGGTESAITFASLSSSGISPCIYAED